MMVWTLHTLFMAHSVLQCCQWCLRSTKQNAAATTTLAKTHAAAVSFRVVEGTLMCRRCKGTMQVSDFHTLCLRLTLCGSALTAPQCHDPNATATATCIGHRLQLSAPRPWQEHPHLSWITMATCGFVHSTLWLWPTPCCRRADGTSGHEADACRHSTLHSARAAAVLSGRQSSPQMSA